MFSYPSLNKDYSSNNNLVINNTLHDINNTKLNHQNNLTYNINDNNQINNVNTNEEIMEYYYNKSIEEYSFYNYYNHNLDITNTKDKSTIKKGKHM